MRGQFCGDEPCRAPLARTFARPGLGDRCHIVIARAVQEISGRAAEIGREQGRANAPVTGMQPREQPDGPAGVQDPASFVRGEPALAAIGVNAVRACRSRVSAPAPDRVHIIVAPAKELRRHRVGRHEGDMHTRHARFVLQRAQQPDVRQFAISGQVIASLRLDRCRAVE